MTYKSIIKYIGYKNIDFWPKNLVIEQIIYFIHIQRRFISTFYKFERFIDVVNHDIKKNYLLESENKMTKKSWNIVK